MERRPLRVGLLGVALAVGACSASKVTPMLGAAAISAGGSHVCALMLDGSQRCWGNDSAGQLGTGRLATGSTMPVSLSLPAVVQMTAGGQHTCARLDDGTVNCWGKNDFGQLGRGTSSPAEPNPAPVAGLTDAIWVTTKGPSIHGELLTDDYTCALLTGGRVACWGQDADGEIGNGATEPSVPSPNIVPGVDGAQSLSLGGGRVYATLSDGTVVAWGSDYDASSTAPVAVAGLTDVVSVAAGENHACALLTDGTVDCWGDNFLGELGNGWFGGDAPIPRPVSGLTGVVALSAGAAHVCALLGDGTVRCWGCDNFGQLGDNGIDNQGAPVQVVNVTDAVAISAGELSTCALLADTAIKCWGMNESGELGNNGTSDSGVRIPVSVVEPTP